MNSTEIVNKDKLSKDVLAFMKKDIENLKENSSKIDFVLKFNEYESLFKAKKIMDNDSGVKSKRAILASDSDGIWYYNSRENRFSQSKRIFEKKFTIIDTVNSKDWKILNEEKRIDNYLCIKAVKKKLLDNGNFFEVVCWFTPEIPIHFGPKEYLGLPGLVIEVVEKNFTFYLKSIDFESIIEIKKPKEGKLISAKDFVSLSRKAYKKRWN